MEAENLNHLLDYNLLWWWCSSIILVCAAAAASLFVNKLASSVV